MLSPLYVVGAKQMDASGCGDTWRARLQIRKLVPALSCLGVRNLLIRVTGVKALIDWCLHFLTLSGDVQIDADAACRLIICPEHEWVIQMDKKPQNMDFVR